jgi:hypothetical protein
MVLDMSESPLSTDAVTGGVRSKFIDILPNLKITNRRGLLLFLMIVSQCHDQLSWSEGRGARGRHVPEVYVSEFDAHEWIGETSRVTVQRKPLFYRGRGTEVRRGAGGGSTNSRATFFTLPPLKEERLQTLLGVGRDRPLDYLLLSDTDSRSLRIQFFQRSHRDRVFEVGFRHKDEIGALYTIARTVADSGFNILSSLIREIDEYHNVWEVVLEYQGPEEKLKSLPKNDPRLAIRRLLRGAAHRYRNELAPYDISIFIPSHLPGWPNKRGWEKGISLGVRSRVEVPQTPELLVREEHGPAERDWLVRYARGVLEKGATVFISCPHTAEKYRSLLATMLQEAGWEVSFYDDTAKMEATYTEARRLVGEADYFVGIWIPDATDAPTTAGTRSAMGRQKNDRLAKPELAADATMSPWLHFELGQAVAFEREFKILASSKLPDVRLVRRIAADRPVFWFSDDGEFLEKAKELLTFMDLNWRERSASAGTPAASAAAATAL